jgi:citrate lyase subunit beta/citryl-CoA lyase
MSLPLTWLYVPGDREDRVPKALRSGADVVVVDLEDAVSVGRKAAARDVARRVLGTHDGPPACQLRVNSVGTRWFEHDAAMVARLQGSVGVRLPKCEEPDAVAAAAEAVGDRAIHLLIESARGLEAAYDLARAHPRVAGIGLGEADLRADLGVTAEAGLAWARSRIVSAAAAAGLGSPAMSVYTDVRDLDGLRTSCLVGRELGLVGRAAIHPVQLPVIRGVFTPTPEEVSRAREVLVAAASATAQGAGALALADGRFVDEAVVRQARRTMRRAGNPLV